MKHLPMLSLRLVRESSVPYDRQPLTCSKAVHALFRGLAEDLDREALWIAALDTQNRVTCLSQISLGSLDSSHAHPREIFKIALLANAKSIILVHNHPSGDTKPSHEDREVTRRIGEAARLLGIHLLDHLIVGEDSFYSFKDEGAIA